MDPNNQPNPVAPPPVQSPPASVPNPAPNAVPPAPQKKSKLGLILGLSVGGGVLVIGAIVLILILTLGGGIKTPADFVQAAKDKKPVNCKLAKDDQAYTIQADEGWGRVKMFGNVDGVEMNILMIDGDATYLWGDNNGVDMAYKMDYDNSTYENFMADIEGARDDSADADVTVECSSEKTDLEIPSDIDFQSTGSATFSD